MKKRRVSFDPYKAAGRKLDQAVTEAAALMRRYDDDASLHPEKRAQAKALALAETRERIGEVLRGTKAKYSVDLERAQARPLPKVNAGNAQAAAYWRQAANDLFASAAPAAVPTLLRQALLDEPGDIARAELLAAAAQHTSGGGWEAQRQFFEVRDRFSTEEERLQRNDHKAIDAAGFRMGLLDEHVKLTLDDLQSLAAAPARSGVETRLGLKIEDTSHPATGWHPEVVLDPELFGKWANCMERDADAAVDAPPVAIPAGAE